MNGFRTAGNRLRGIAVTTALALLLTGCVEGTPGEAQASAAAGGENEVGGILAIEDGDEGLLGSVNLPRPDWLPAGMPFPDDAHIMLTTHIPRDGEPDLFMVQANSFVKPAPYAHIFLEWAEAKGLDPEQDARFGDERPVVGFKGADGSPASLQTTPQDGGLSRIMIAFAGQRDVVGHPILPQHHAHAALGGLGIAQHGRPIGTDLCRNRTVSA